VHKGDAMLQVHREKGGAIVAQRAEERTHAELAALLAKQGFRFPTSDEWELACGAASPALFRWGDHVPCDRYPTDLSPEEAKWRRQWALSRGELEEPAEGFVSDWDFHLRPSAWGVYIASNPYHCELLAESNLTRGGDGGQLICGGVGFFLGWLTLATAYCEADTCERHPEEPVDSGYTIGRRVLPLG